MDRRRFLATAGALPALALPGCGFVRRDASQEALSFTTWGTESELTAFRSAIDGFQEAYDTRVQMNAVPFEQMFQNVDAQLQAGNPPDVFRVDYDSLGTYAGRGQLLDLSDLLEPSVGERFTPAMWRAVQNDGRPYGVPHHTDTSVVLFNTEALRSAGVEEVPSQLEDAWTWDRFADVARSLRGSLPDDRYPFAVNWQSQGVTRWLSWLFQADGRLLDERLTGPAIVSDAGRTAVEFTSSFFTERFVPPNSSVKASTYASDLFFGETVAMVFGGAFLLPDAESLADFGWGATFAPREARGGSDLGGNALVATAATEKREQAAAFLSYMTEREEMERFCVTSSALPTRRDLVSDGIRFTVRPELSPIFVGQATTVQPQDAAQVASSSMSAINTVLSDQLEQAFVGGQAVDQTLEGMATGIERALAR